MTTTTASAPGKIVLCGEYAVLQGAPAICMAVNRRARVTLEPGTAGCHVLSTPGYCEGDWRFRWSTEDGFRWLDRPPAPRAFALVEEVWRLATPAADLALTVDTRDFVDDRNRKLGLGASAAAAVALAAALARQGGTSSAPAGIAATAHRRFQDGHGSGADIATSVRGGLIEYRQSDPAGSATVAWPAGLRCAFLFSGQPASTAGMLAALDGQDRGAADRSLVEQSERAARAWHGGEAAAVIAALRDYAVALWAFDRDHALGIFGAGHAGLLDMTASSEVVFKPCGAGGGDIGALFAVDEAALDRYAGMAAQRGFTLMPLAADERGVLCPDPED